MMNWKRKVSFSQSVANALTLGWQSIRIWGRDDVGYGLSKRSGKYEQTTQVGTLSKVELLFDLSR